MSEETQLQRVVRKQRAGEFGKGGTITIHCFGYSMDSLWRNKREFKLALASLAANPDNLWKIVKATEKLAKKEKKTTYMSKFNDTWGRE